MPRPLPHQGPKTFLTYTGMETDLIFTQGIDLPGFASFPLLQTPEGRAHLTRYATDLAAIASRANLGVILESATWVASADRAAPLGYDARAVAAANLDAIALLSELRPTLGDLPTLISANIGPRHDAYAPETQMTADEAAAYHIRQIATLAATDADLITAYTMADPTEAIGILQACRDYYMPCVIAFTVETNGLLPTGGTLEAAISQVDAATNGYAAYYMINCAHPDHFTHVLTDASWARRVGGIVANASRCSHAELDNASELDAGNPAELGRQLANLRQTHPHLRVLGGCCGTDMRHLDHLARFLAC
ncbi:homocysteine S-methyltransferase family protein [Shimia sagamensis]|uniref:Homocysteine S-methyltransferase n=1 Tax=Shimia sagamensis TaxID=1566352 RepID=A0ABY1P777_9RHOB|nr:homocysteine S-methyltransferase family protein [Shimia sagamensis]SMP26496.1 homocysteine S-methyltransferase [Shimia sagamensis]